MLDCLQQSVAGYLGLALAFVWGSAPREGGGLISIFREFFASASEIFIFYFWIGGGRGERGTRLSLYEV